MFLFKTDLQNHECDDKSDDQGHDKTSRRHFHIGDVTGFSYYGKKKSRSYPDLWGFIPRHYGE